MRWNAFWNAVEEVWGTKFATAKFPKPDLLEAVRNAIVQRISNAPVACQEPDIYVCWDLATLIPKIIPTECE
jgi:hypothetical protein